MEDKMKKWYAFGIALALTLVLVGCASAPKSGSPSTVTILAVNDFHGALDESSGQTGNPGAAKLVGTIKALVAENPETTIVLSAGDNYQGSAVSNLNYGKPVSDMFKQMGLKLSAAGNHEFDWVKGSGAYYFEDWEKQAGLTYLGANILDKGTGNIANFVKPYQILNIQGLKIGIIGIITRETAALVTARNIASLEFADPIAVTQKYYDQLKKECDAVIVLGHIGAVMEDTAISGEAADLAQALPDLTAIISGHSHTVVNGLVNTVPIVQAGSNGRYISKLDIHFDTKRKVTGVEASLINISSAEGKAGAPIDEESAKLIAQYKNDLAPLMARVVGYNDTALETKPEVADWLCKLLYDYLLRTEGKPYIVTQNDGGVRSGGIPLPAGDITVNYMYGLMPFDNSMVVMELTGAELISIIERPDSELISKLDYYGVQKVDGTYRLVYDNAPIDPAGTYNLMCNDFMYTGGDNFNFSAGKNVRQLGVPLRDAMIEETLFRIGKTSSRGTSKELLTRLSLAALTGY
jgi:2',3'-cyclic-nucleotide 2'-phosphodiesterase/3'-nucleotidase